MLNTSIIVNTKKTKPTDGKVGGISNSSTPVNVHTIKAEDLRIMRPIPGQGGLSVVLKLEG